MIMFDGIITLHDMFYKLQHFIAWKNLVICNLLKYFSVLLDIWSLCFCITNTFAYRKSKNKSSDTCLFPLSG